MFHNITVFTVGVHKRTNCKLLNGTVKALA